MLLLFPNRLCVIDGLPPGDDLIDDLSKSFSLVSGLKHQFKCH